MKHNPLLSDVSYDLPKAVGVIGAGTIGPDIGYYLKSAIPGLRLVLVDIDPKALVRAVERIDGYVAKGLKKGKLTEEQAKSVKDNLVTTVDYADLKGCDWVLEAATENLELKRKIFTQVEAVVDKTAIITSNTSSLPATRLFSHLKHPERTTVTHFFAPAFRNPVVEVITWDGMDKGLVDRLRWIFATTGKVPMVTTDVPCFMLDRVFDNWCNEAAYLLDGASASEVDSVASEFVHAGPFFVLNLANGNPIIVETNTLQMEEGEHYRPAPILSSVGTWTTLRPGKTIDVPTERAGAIRDRLLGVLFSQAVDIVDSNIASPEDLNLGCCLALGFKQGPFDLMAQLGDAEVKRIFERFTTERPGMPVPKKDLSEYQTFSRWVHVDDLDGVKVITLRRPQAMNALDDRMTDDVLEVIERYENDDAVKGFVITGYGERAFCAGADIGRFPEMLGKADEAAQFARDCSRLLLRLDAMKKPVVAAINGMALGGGLELALRCHSIVATKDAWFQFPEVKLGIAPGIGGMVVPYRRWPKAASIFHDMLRIAKRLEATAAEEWGIVDGLADGYRDLITLAVQKVRDLDGALPTISDAPADMTPLGDVQPRGSLGGPNSLEVIAIIGEAIESAAKATSLSDALEIGYQAFGRSACTKAAEEGIAAFLAHR